MHAEAIVKGGPGEILNGLSEVIHAHNDTAVFGKTHYFMLDGFGAIIGGEGEGDGASTGDFEVGGAVLVATGVTADDDGFFPAGDKARHIGHDDGSAEDSTAEDIANGAVGGFPHFLEAEFFHSGLIGGDGGTCLLYTSDAADDQSTV